MRIRHEEIKRRRELLTLTQEEAAVRAGWSKGDDVPARRRAMRRWSDVERGRWPDMQVSTLADVARVLRCKLDDLVEI